MSRISSCRSDLHRQSWATIWRASSMRSASDDSRPLWLSAADFASFLIGPVRDTLAASLVRIGLLLCLVAKTNVAKLLGDVDAEAKRKTFRMALTNACQGETSRRAWVLTSSCLTTKRASGDKTSFIASKHWRTRRCLILKSNDTRIDSPSS